MADITELILADHGWFRAQFARLDYLQAQTPLDVDAVSRVWTPLAEKLDLHADAEERIFYPQLLLKGKDNAEDETLDAIGDHNDIRDGVRDAGDESLGSDAWWAAVGRARAANDEHMGEEEREGLSDMRRNTAAGLLEALGRQYVEYFEQHKTTAGVDTSDKDPQTYVDRIERGAGRADAAEGSLGIGSLKGQ